jgi:hypothetical protein
VEVIEVNRTWDSERKKQRLEWLNGEAEGKCLDNLGMLRTPMRVHPRRTYTWKTNVCSATPPRMANVENDDCDNNLGSGYVNTTHKGKQAPAPPNRVKLCLCHQEMKGQQ